MIWWYIVCFLIGCMIAFVRYKIKQKKIERAFVELYKMNKSIQEKENILHPKLEES